MLKKLILIELVILNYLNLLKIINLKIIRDKKKISKFVHHKYSTVRLIYLIRK